MTGIRSRSIAHSLGRMLVGLLALCAPSPLCAENELSVRANDAAVAYRRVFVPAGETAVWPRDGEKFLPVEARDFEAWVTAANRAAPTPTSEASITEAMYSARLEDGQLVDGRGEWTIGTRGGEPVIVALGPMSLAVREAQWKNDPATAVRLGAWGRSGDEASAMGLEVSQSGVVAFRWRVPARAAAEGVEFDWRFPQATTTRLELDLPAGKRPVWEGSLTLRSTDLHAGGEASDANPGWQRWEMIAGPEAQSLLRIVDAQTGATVAAPAPSLVLREDVSYDITPRGLDIEAQLRLEDLSSANHQLSIPLPERVQLVSATVDGRDLSWRLATDERAAPARAIIELPASAPGVATTIVLRAWQVPVLDAKWQLPKLRPDDVFWAAGTMRLSVSPHLELRSIETSDCVQTGVHLSEDDGGTPETISLAEYSPASKVEMVIGQRAPVTAASIGTTLVVGNGDVTGRSVTQLQVAGGAVHTLSGELPSGWNVDAVETTPSDALGQWHVDVRDGERRIEVRLAEAVRPGRPVTVTLTGRFQPADLGAPLSAEMLRMVRWRETDVARNLLAVQTAEPYVVETVGELPLVAVEDLTEVDRSLLAAAAEGPIYDVQDVADAAAVRLVTKRGEYTAEIRLDALLTGDELRQTYHLVARPQAGRVDQILVYTTAKVDGEIRWTESSTGRAIAAERVAPGDPRRARFPADGELWHVHLIHPRASSVEVDATFATRLGSRGRIPLMSLPEARDQRGRVLLRIDVGQSPQIEVRGLRAIPLPPDGRNVEAHGNRSRIWAAYRYEPAECQNAARQPEFWLEPTTNDTASGASGSPVVARQLELESRYSASGDAAHRATYHLDSEHAQSVQIRLPEGAQLTSADVDGRSLDLPMTPDADQLLTVPLPADGAAIASVSFTTQEPRLAPGRQLSPPVIEGDMPIMSGEWTVWLPTEFVALGAGANETMNWRQRLFGPLGRPTGARPFDPLGGGSWSSLVTGWADEAPAGEAVHGDASNELRSEGASGVVDVGGRGEREAPPIGTDTTSGVPSASEPIGWRAYRRVSMAGVPAPIVIDQPPATTAWSIAIFLLCLAGGGLARRRREWFIVFIATAAILCLMLPAVYAPLATGAFLGLLTSLFIVWPQRSDPAEAPTRTWNRFAAAGTSAPALVIVLVNLATAQVTNDGVTERSAEPAAIERVLIPVDAERRPVGTKVYVGEKFLRHLMAHGAESSTAGGQWLLTGAAYRGELQHGAQGDETVVGQWSMAFDIEVLGRDTTIRIPLVRDEAAWPATVELDGIPFPLAWDADGRSCAVEVAEPGRYELTISFVPRVRDSAGRNQISLAVPPQWGGAFELRHPAGMNDLEVTGSNWQPGVEQAADVMRGELDETGRIVLRWPQAGAPAGTKEARLTELRWLRIGVDGVEMNVKYVAPRGARLPQTLAISADRQWELVTDENAARDVRPTDEEGRRNGIQVALRAEDRERGEVTLRWRLVDPPAVGYVRVPPMELVAPQISTSWIAVSSDPTLKCEVINAAGLPEEAVDEFLTLWGTGERVEPPQIVLGSVASSSALSVGVRPRRVDSEIDEVLHVAAGTDLVRAQYQAEVAPSHAHRFQFQLTVPNELAIDQVGVTQGGRSVATRWSRPSADLVNVFFGEELAEPYRLTLTGHVRVTGSGDCILPRVASASLRAVVERVQLYRDESVLVDVEGPANVDDAAADLAPAGWKARLVGAYQVESSAAGQVRLAIKPNSVATVGETLTILSHEEAMWWATWCARLVVRQGELDTLRLRVPGNWLGPFDVSPAGATVVAAKMSGSRYAVLAVHLPESIGAGKALALELRGPLTPESGAPVTVPEIVSESPAEWRSYLSVPTSVQSQDVTWTRDGVRPAEPPSNLRPSQASATLATVFRATSSPYRVALEPQQEARPSASVRLADTVVARGQDGNQLVATRFVIFPLGLTDCELQLPGDQHLVCARLDGRPARIRPLAGQRSVVSLGAPQLPQILDVVSRDIQSTASPVRRVELQRPVLYAGDRPLPVEMSLWSFGQPQIAGEPRIDGASLVSAADQAGLRLDRLAGIAEAATSSAVALPIPDGYDWFRAWAMLLTDAQEAARAASAMTDRMAAASQVTRSSGEQLAPAADRIASWIERSYDALGWPELDPPIDPAPVADDTYKWPPTVNGVSDWIHCVADGSADRMTVELSRADSGSGLTHLLGALAVAGIAAGTAWLTRRPAARDWLYRWPHAAGALVGVCWWAWLWPSWLGLAIAAGCLLLLFRPGWPGRSIRPEASTVLRVGRPR